MEERKKKVVVHKKKQKKKKQTRKLEQVNQSCEEITSRLPKEIWIGILDMLSLDDLNACCLVSRSWHRYCVYNHHNTLTHTTEDS